MKRIDHKELLMKLGAARKEAGDAWKLVEITTPEKALLDLIYLTPRADSAVYLRELRIQHPERLDLQRLTQMALASGSDKLMRAVALVSNVLQQEEY